VERKDFGTRQWTYKGEALYTYAGDYAPAEVTGNFTGDKSVQAALVYRNFMPTEVAINSYVGRGPLLTTSKGLTLYYAARFIGIHGGRDTRNGGYGMTYNDAKSQGAGACQTDCTQSWIPVLASKNAEASGFWEIVARPDGAKQWAFKGSPVYSFVGDKPGEIAGNNRSVIVYGGADGQVFYSYAEADPSHPAPHVGKVDMAFAIGKPTEDDTPTPPVPAAGAAAAKGAAPAAGGAQSANNTNTAGNNRVGLRASGAGFYWHTVSLSY
jgi:predicted lipoprotein with Yx(FWY)xxD motif